MYKLMRPYGIDIKFLVLNVLFILVVMVVPCRAIERVTVYTLATEADTFIGKELTIEGIIETTGQCLILHSYDLVSGKILTAMEHFASDWKENTAPQIVQELEMMQEKSGLTFPYKGLTIAQSKTEFAYIVFKGRLEHNSEYRSSPTASPQKIKLSLGGNEEKTSPYLLNIHRIR